MKKTAFILLICFALPGLCHASELQLKEAGIFAESIVFDNSRIYHGGFKFNVGWDSFSVYYLFSIGMSSDDQIYGHIPGGVAVAEYIVSSPGYNGLSEDSKEDFNTVLMIILLFLPDGLEIPLKISDSFQIVPNISWSGGEINLNNNKDVLFSWGAGTRFRYVSDSFFMGPYVGIKGIYATGEKGFVYGFDIGAKW